MRDEDDFWAFVAARWPALVRSLVDRGCPEHDAPGLAAEALRRCRRRWAAAVRSGDAEEMVDAEADAVWARRRRARRTSPVDEPGPAAGPAPPTPADLDELDRRHRATTARRAVAVLTPVVLVVAGLTWWGARPDDEGRLPRPDDLGPAAVEHIENPVDTAWWADDTLHLAHVTVRAPGLRDLTALGEGAVYDDQVGRVVHVADDGGRTVLGQTLPGQTLPGLPFAATAETGWAAWVEPVDGAASQIVVYRADRDELVGRLELDAARTASTRVVAVDGQVVYYRDDQGAYAWLPVGDSVLPVTPAQLLDVRHRLRVYQQDPSTIQAVQSAFNVAYSWPGSGAVVAPDGVLVASRLDQSSFGRLVLYDARSGASLPTGLVGDEVAVAFSLAERQRVTYVVAHAPDMLTTGPFLRSFDAGDLELRSCDVAAGTCSTVLRLPDARSAPVLAR